jgi:predicted phosphodiesterase
VSFHEDGRDEDEVVRVLAFLKSSTHNSFILSAVTSCNFRHFPFSFCRCIVTPVSRKTPLFLIALALLLTPLYVWAQHAPFAIVSDTHVGVSDSLYPEFIHRIEEEKIQVIIHTGDAINSPGSSGQWARFFEITGPAKTLHLAPGNHDIYGKRALAVYLKFFAKPYYSFSSGDTVFILLNTELPGEEGMVAKEQLVWLETELQQPFRHKFVFLHEPPYPMMALHGLDRHNEARDALHRLFVKKGVSLVVAGHDHIYDRTTRDGIVYVIAPATRAQPRFSPQNGAPGYIVTTRKGDGFSFTVKDIQGNVRERFSVTR